MTTYAFFPQFSSGAYMGTAPAMFTSTGAPLIWSSAVIAARTQQIQTLSPKPDQRKQKAITRVRWGWEIARGAQGQSRPYGYHGRHGKHPGYGPTGYKRLDRMAQIAKQLTEVTA